MVADNIERTFAKPSITELRSFTIPIDENKKGKIKERIADRSD